MGKILLIQASLNEQSGEAGDQLIEGQCLFDRSCL
jgi:hypothetical protein